MNDFMYAGAMSELTHLATVDVLHHKAEQVLGLETELHRRQECVRTLGLRRDENESHEY
jgi:hypothetical protein